MSDVTCELFEDAADDLALGYASEPARAALLAHASSCASCGALLRNLSTTVDRLLELAPEAEPPVGFETRAVAMMGPQKRGRPGARLVGAAAVCIAIGMLAGIAIARSGERSAPGGATDVAASIVTASGTSFGRAELYRRPRARIVIVLDGQTTGHGAWSCDLQARDGSWTTVGVWTASDAPSGVWTSAVADDLAGSSTMRIRGADGTVIATGHFG